MSERETALSRSQIATLRELADDLSQIVVAVSSRDGDATARQHQRAEAVRAAVEWLAGADPVPVCQPETWWAVYQGGQPYAAYPRKVQAEIIYASGFYREVEIKPLALVPAEETSQS